VTAWLIWVLIAAVLAVGEVLSLALVLAMAAVGALAAAAVAAAGGGLALELVAFVLVSAALLMLVRPLAQRSLRGSLRLRTGTAALVGKTAVVLERVDAEGGRIKVAGEVW
jgi:membrane protein implicated in regulation of membrane protease activity